MRTGCSGSSISPTLAHASTALCPAKKVHLSLQGKSVAGVTFLPMILVEPELVDEYPVERGQCRHHVQRPAPTTTTGCWLPHAHSHYHHHHACHTAPTAHHCHPSSGDRHYRACPTSTAYGRAAPRPGAQASCQHTILRQKPKRRRRRKW